MRSGIDSLRGAAAHDFRESKISGQLGFADEVEHGMVKT
jgi:hypothetical protein